MAALFSLNLFFSINVPVTLEKLFFYLTSLTLFIFFLSLPKSKIEIPLFLYYLSLSSLVLHIFVLFFTFVPFPPLSFPGMNLLVRVFGHNYYVAYLLLVIPVFWWQFLYASDQSFASKKEMRVLAIVLLVLSYLLMIFSLARFSMLVGFLQLMLIFWANKKRFIDLLGNQFAHALTKAFLLVLLVLVCAFSMLPLFFGKEVCPVNFSYKEMCKPLLANDRFQYWQKAFWIWQEKPFFGSGLKTFGFASRQFVLENYNYSSYAHNNFFHNLAEGGLVVGSCFIFFILYLLRKSYVVVQRHKHPLNHFLFFAVLASWMNAMFDLTWNFFVIFSLTLIFIAFILSHDETPQWRSRVFVRFLHWLTVVTIFFAAAYLCDTALIKSKQIDRAIKLFPFFDQPVRSLSIDDHLSEENYAKLYPLYRFDPGFVHNFSQAKGISNEKRIALLVELGKLDPVLLVESTDFEKLDFREAKPLIDEFIRVVTTHRMVNNLHFLDYWKQGNLALDVLRFADQAYDAGELVIAADLYHQALVLNEHLYSNRKPVFLGEQNLDQAAHFLIVFQNFDPQSLGNFYEYMDLYQQTLLHLFKSNRLSEFYELTNAILEFLPDHAWFLIRDLVEISQTAEEKARLQEVYQKLQHLEAWQGFLPLPL